MFVFVCMCMYVYAYMCAYGAIRVWIVVYSIVVTLQAPIQNE